MDHMRTQWTREENKALKSGIERHGVGKWVKIQKHPDLHQRTCEEIEKRFWRLRQLGQFRKSLDDYRSSRTKLSNASRNSKGRKRSRSRDAVVVQHEAQNASSRQRQKREKSLKASKSSVREEREDVAKKRRRREHKGDDKELVEDDDGDMVILDGVEPIPIPHSQSPSPSPSPSPSFPSSGKRKQRMQRQSNRDSKEIMKEEEEKEDGDGDGDGDGDDDDDDDGDDVKIVREQCDIGGDSVWKRRFELLVESLDYMRQVYIPLEGCKPLSMADYNMEWFQKEWTKFGDEPLCLSLVEDLSKILQTISQSRFVARKGLSDSDAAKRQNQRLQNRNHHLKSQMGNDVIDLTASNDSDDVDDQTVQNQALKASVGDKDDGRSGAARDGVRDGDGGDGVVGKGGDGAGEKGIVDGDVNGDGDGDGRGEDGDDDQRIGAGVGDEDGDGDGDGDGGKDKDGDGDGDKSNVKAKLVSSDDNGDVPGLIAENARFREELDRVLATMNVMMANNVMEHTAYYGDGFALDDHDNNVENDDNASLGSVDS